MDDRRNGDSVLRHLVSREGLPHPYRQAEDPERVDLGRGSDVVLAASKAGFEQVCAQTPTVANWGRSPLSAGAQKARVTRSLGQGIRDEMGGYECRSEWARENALKTLSLSAKKGR